MSANYLEAFPSYVVEHNLHYTHQLALYWLCHYADDEGLVVQPVKELSELTSISTSALYGIFRDLREAGALEILQEGLGHAERSYRLLIPVPPERECEADLKTQIELPLDIRRPKVMVKPKPYEIHVHIHQG